MSRDITYVGVGNKKIHSTFIWVQLFNLGDI
jgi:hypothetical protein